MAAEIKTIDYVLIADRTTTWSTIWQKSRFWIGKVAEGILSFRSDADLSVVLFLHNNMITKFDSMVTSTQKLGALCFDYYIKTLSSVISLKKLQPSLDNLYFYLMNTFHDAVKVCAIIFISEMCQNPPLSLFVKITSCQY